MTAHIFQRKKFSTKDRELFHFTPAVRNKGKEKTTAALSGSFLFLCGVETKRKILRFYEIFGKIAKCGVVRIKGKFTQINVHFAFCWFVGIGEKVSAALAKSLRVALKVLKEKFFAGTQQTSRKGLRNIAHTLENSGGIRRKSR